jgi:hypothetical protein
MDPSGGAADIIQTSGLVPHNDKASDLTPPKPAQLLAELGTTRQEWPRIVTTSRRHVLP